MEFKQWAKLQESLLKAQLKIIRQFLKEGEQPKFKPRGKGRSQMSIIYDLLLAAQKPLHVTDFAAWHGWRQLNQKAFMPCWL